MTSNSNSIDLLYGHTAVNFQWDTDRFAVVEDPSKTEQPLTDFEVGAALDAPIGSPPLDEIIDSEDSVLIVVSDATRPTASAQVVNLLVRRLVQMGVSPPRIAVIFATGIHRRVTEQEKLELLTPFIVQRVQILEHDAYDPAKLVSFGRSAGGVEVQLSSALRDYSRVILTGGINFHYFAGFTGGRKSICPGLASAETIKATHMLALDLESGNRQAGVGTGLLDGNAVHEDCERIAAVVEPAFAINAIVNQQKRAVKLFCGDWRRAHRAACEYYLNHRSLKIAAKRDLVIASCGGFPYDINLIQAHKALDMASYACNDGGTIVLLAECSDGLGRPDFLKWFESADSRALAERLRSEYEVNGQTAWALLTKAERYRVCLVSQLPDEQVKQMRMIPARSLDEALEGAAATEGFVMPRGAAVLPRIEE
ncbi:MAG: nickel-dependent lactate racemase [Acidobacteria bacterium]|nr:nickel-dependent lactate racemase [Acidobacteriota bacterium]MCA1627227.1 nickel-dependent lactate racemase [Acidobacteriota bacterium]